MVLKMLVGVRVTKIDFQDAMEDQRGERGLQYSKAVCFEGIYKLTGKSLQDVTG
jgi:hypothetical protein